MKILFVFLMIYCVSGRAQEIYFKNKLAKSNESSLQTINGRDCEKTLDAAMNACQGSYQAKTQGDASIAQRAQAAAGRNVIQASGSMATAVPQMNSLTNQTQTVCRSAYSAYMKRCEEAKQYLQGMLKWPHKASRDKAAHDLPEIDKMQANAQSVFSGMGDQLNATNAAEVKAMEGATNTLNQASGSPGSANTNMPTESAPTQSQNFPGCAALGVSGDACTNELNKWYSGDRSALSQVSGQPAQVPAQPTQPVQAAQPASNDTATTSTPNPSANGPQTLADCGYGQKWSGTSECTAFLNNYYLKKTQDQQAAAAAAAAKPTTRTPPATTKPTKTNMINGMFN